ncbi:MAG: hypothetical protein ABL903_13810 [Methylococcales bacterium]
MRKPPYLLATLLTLTPLAANAACEVIPLTTAQMSGTQVDGKIISGEECRGVGDYSSYTADRYSFKGKAGDIVTGNLMKSSFNSYNTAAQLLDTKENSIALALINGSPGSSSQFEVRLKTDGIYTLAISYVVGSQPQTYSFKLSSTNPEQTSIPTPTPAPIPTPTPAPEFTCLENAYKEGVAALTSVSVPDGIGGMIKYKVSLAVEAFSNPLKFKVDKADIILSSTPAAACASDSYKDGKLNINSITVPNASMGGTDKYKVTMQLEAGSDPLKFTVETADLIK